MRIAFWNMQRLGADSPKREEAIRYLLMTVQPDYLLLCELTSTHPNGQSHNSNPYTLRYACFNAAGGNVPLQFVQPTSTDDYKQAQFKGGNDFSKLSPRGLAHIVIVDNDTNIQLPIYAYHAPSSHNAIKAVSFVGCALNEEHDDDPWIVIGDFNVEPQKLATAPVGIRMDDLILAPDTATHRGGKTLDYALTNIEDSSIYTVRRSMRLTGSDHNPVVVDFNL